MTQDLFSALKFRSYLSRIVAFSVELIVDDDRHNGEEVFSARTWDLQKSIVSVCKGRGHDDEWEGTVSRRSTVARYFPAVDAVYHKVCSVNFLAGRNIPSKDVKQDESKFEQRGPIQVKNKHIMVGRLMHQGKKHFYV